MKTRFILICSLFGLLFLMSACAGNNTSVTVSCDEFTASPDIEKTVSAAVGNILMVTLCSNPSTGFSWTEDATIGNTNILSQKSHRFIATETDPNIVGAAGTEEWVFNLKEAGTTTIYLDYSREWEGGEKGAQTFKLIVTVK